MKADKNKASNREYEDSYETEKATFVKTNVTGETVFEESEYSIIEKDLVELNKNLEEQIEEQIYDHNSFSKLL